MSSDGSNSGGRGRMGLGTAIERVTTRAGIKPCSGCKKRKAFLDRAMPNAVPQPGPNAPAWLRELFGGQR